MAFLEAPESQEVVGQAAAVVELDIGVNPLVIISVAWEATVE
jgi:hypothetical protein